MIPERLISQSKLRRHYSYFQAAGSYYSRLLNRDRLPRMYLGPPQREVFNCARSRLGSPVSKLLCNCLRWINFSQTSVLGGAVTVIIGNWKPGASAPNRVEWQTYESLASWRSSPPPEPLKSWIYFFCSRDNKYFRVTFKYLSFDNWGFIWLPIGRDSVASELSFTISKDKSLFAANATPTILI